MADVWMVSSRIIFTVMLVHYLVIVAVIFIVIFSANYIKVAVGKEERKEITNVQKLASQLRDSKFNLFSWNLIQISSTVAL